MFQTPPNKWPELAPKYIYIKNHWIFEESIKTYHKKHSLVRQLWKNTSVWFVISGQIASIPFEKVGNHLPSEWARTSNFEILTKTQTPIYSCKKTSIIPSAWFIVSIHFRRKKVNVEHWQLSNKKPRCLHRCVRGNQWYYNWQIYKFMFTIIFPQKIIVLIFNPFDFLKKCQNTWVLMHVHPVIQLSLKALRLFHEETKHLGKPRPKFQV